MATKTKKLGRPDSIDWSKFRSLWRNLTNIQIAKLAGCTPVCVYIRRKKLIDEAEAAGKPASPFICKLPKWTHGDIGEVTPFVAKKILAVKKTGAKRT
jgi:hypothetical protein